MVLVGDCKCQVDGGGDGDCDSFGPEPYVYKQWEQLKEFYL